jgi:hypothetical protein
VPVISLTAQAFLFTIALGPESRPFARVVACSLALAITILSMLLLARHRQADIADAHWLADLETRRHRASKEDLVAHGPTWRARREATEIHPLFNWMKRWRAFIFWEVGLLLFGLAAIAVVVVTFAAPWLLDSPVTDVRLMP